MQNKQKKMIPVRAKSSLITVVLLILFLLFFGIYLMKILGIELDIGPSGVIFLMVLIASYLAVSYLTASLINSYVRFLYSIPIFIGITILIGICLLSFDWSRAIFNPFVTIYLIALYLPVVFLQLFWETGDRDKEFMNTNSAKRLPAPCAKWKNFRLLVILSLIMLFQASFILYVAREFPAPGNMHGFIEALIFFICCGIVVLAISIGTLIALRKVKKDIKAVLFILFFPSIFVFFSLVYFFALISLSGRLVKV